MPGIHGFRTRHQSPGVHLNGKEIQSDKNLHLTDGDTHAQNALSNTHAMVCVCVYCESVGERAFCHIWQPAGLIFSWLVNEGGILPAAI